MTKVSVVTVSFNQARFLAECLDSVLGQSYPEIEYIVMDGGSTDGSVDLIRARAERLAFWTSTPDAGAAAALNSGFAQATGDIFAYLNSDDVLEPDAVSKWVEAVQSHPEVGVVYGDLAIIDAEGKPATLPGRRVRLFRAGHWSIRNHAAGAVAIPQQATAWRRAVAEMVGPFNEANRTCWDGEFFAIAAMKGVRFRHLPGVLARFRVHESSISGSNRSEARYREDQARIDGLWRQSGVIVPAWERRVRRVAVQANRLAQGILGGRQA